MKIDESTGLPELPEGYFWRVGLTFNETKINLLKRRRFAWNKEIGSAFVFLRHRDSPEAALRRAAKRVLEDRDSSFTLREYLGDYPPKKLESM